MEKRARKGELVDDISDTGSHEQIERVVVSKLQHPTHQWKQKGSYIQWAKHFEAWSARLPSHLLNGLAYIFHRVLSAYFNTTRRRHHSVTPLSLSDSPKWPPQRNPPRPRSRQTTHPICT
jgi:hypothetical protein